ncbi:hypothetical protein [Rhodobacter lacus]|uniref:Type II secretion system protein GspC N-terminal domain-containing protein n=1 Tax=Rhodobacter lacus TaxID=1641972 RepID=A0ABW5AB85_9RHOB
MLALFIALSFAVGLVLWAEVRAEPKTERKREKTAEPAPQTAPGSGAPVASLERPEPDADAAVMAQLARLLAEPAPPHLGATLPRITGFCAGDVIELAIEGPLPRPEDLHIEQIGPDAQVSLDGTPALIIEATRAQSLAPGAIRFRPAKAA